MAANVNDVTVAAKLLHGEDGVVDGDAGDHGLAKPEEMAPENVDCPIAIRSGKCRQLPQGSPELPYRFCSLRFSVPSLLGWVGGFWAPGTIRQHPLWDVLE